MVDNSYKTNNSSLNQVEELFKIVTATAAIMIVLLWGLLQKDIGGCVIWIIRVASILFVLSILMSLLGYQFIVTKIQNEKKDITIRGPVPLCFLVSWISFVLGCFGVACAIFYFS